MQGRALKAERMQDFNQLLSEARQGDRDAFDLVIRSGSEEPISQVQVYSLSGALVAEISHPALIHRVSTSPLGTGIYLVRTFSNDGIYKQKVLIQ